MHCFKLFTEYNLACLRTPLLYPWNLPNYKHLDRSYSFQLTLHRSSVEIMALSQFCLLYLTRIPASSAKFEIVVTGSPKNQNVTTNMKLSRAKKKQKTPAGKFFELALNYIISNHGATPQILLLNVNSSANCNIW